VLAVTPFLQQPFSKYAVCFSTASCPTEKNFRQRAGDELFLRAWLRRPQQLG
jgi:hypothetical protein